MCVSPSYQIMALCLVVSSQEYERRYFQKARKAN